MSCSRSAGREGSRSLRSETPWPRLPLARILPGSLFQAKLWAVNRSPSLVGLLYLPVPERPIAVPRPRTSPTPLRPFDPERLARGETVLGGKVLALIPPLPWHDADPALSGPLHDGEEVLALVRLAVELNDARPARAAREI